MTPFQEESLQLFNTKVKELEKRDWNKDWPTATREAPKVCVCGKKLERAQPKGKLLMPISKTFPRRLVQSFNCEWRIDCNCGVCFIWSYPNIWKRTHRISELHMFVQPDGKLLRPYPIL